MCGTGIGILIRRRWEERKEWGTETTTGRAIRARTHTSGVNVGRFVWEFVTAAPRCSFVWHDSPRPFYTNTAPPPPPWERAMGPYEVAWTTVDTLSPVTEKLQAKCVKCLDGSKEDRSIGCERSVGCNGEVLGNVGSYLIASRMPMPTRADVPIRESGIGP